MNLYEARHLARSLLVQHGLSDWTFAFDHARRRFGSCRPGQKMITLSRPLTLMNNLDQVRDTILHEIAHALTPGDGHGPRWKAMCARIGALPKRCYTDDQVASPPRPPAKYQLGCPRCDWWVERRRVNRRKLVCSKCRTGIVQREKC